MYCTAILPKKDLTDTIIYINMLSVNSFFVVGSTINRMRKYYARIQTKVSRNRAERWGVYLQHFSWSNGV